jgi:hypothetical protein
MGEIQPDRGMPDPGGHELFPASKRFPSGHLSFKLLEQSVHVPILPGLEKRPSLKRRKLMPVTSNDLPVVVCFAVDDHLTHTKFPSEIACSGVTRMSDNCARRLSARWSLFRGCIRNPPNAMLAILRPPILLEITGFCEEKKDSPGDLVRLPQ